jgi:dienelactone hydrolase
MSNLNRIMIFLSLTVFFTSLLNAQNASATITPELVRIPASDELILVGDYYALEDAQSPTVLLFHGLEMERSQWTPLIQPLREAGYNALAVDVRGYGETGGEINWQTAVGDIETWLNWLREQPTVQTNGISILGADIGGSLAMIGCGSDSECISAIVLAPIAIACGNRDCSEETEGIDVETLGYLDEIMEPALTETSRSILLIIGREDKSSIPSIQQMRSLFSDQITVTATVEREKVMQLLDRRGNSAVQTIINWLDGRTPANLTPDAIETLVAASDPANGQMLFYEGLVNDQEPPCIECHYTDSEATKSGPGFLNISGRAATRVDGQSAAVYFYNSIVAPDYYTVEGYNAGTMPLRYDHVFTETQIADLVAYLLTL